MPEAGADINRATYDATFTSLHHALAKGHMEVARLLVEKVMMMMMMLVMMLMIMMIMMMLVMMIVL